MNYVGKLLSNFKYFYNEINSATLTGAIDVVAIQHEDGSLVSSPFHVRFGKIGVLRSREKVVDIEVNGKAVDLHMKLGEAGEAFFVQAAELSSEIPAHLATSPLPDTLELMEKGIKEMKEDRGLQEEKTKEERPAVLAGASVSDTILTVAPPVGEIIDVSKSKSEAIIDIEDEDKTEGDTIVGSPGKGSDVGGLESVVTVGSPVLSSHISGTKADTPKGSPTHKGSPIGVAKNEIKPDSLKGSPSNKSLSRGESSSVQPDTSKSGLDETDTSVVRFDHKDSSTSCQKFHVEKELYESSRSKRRKKKKQRKRLETSSTSTTKTDEDMPEIFEMDLSDDEKDEMGVPRSLSMPVMEDRHARTEEWANSHVGIEIHPFSDGDITPILSPVATRPPSPKSDTEYENQAQRQAHEEDNTTYDDHLKWEWGGLPEGKMQADTDKATKGQELDEKQSGGLFQFMRSTKKIRHQPEHGGIYLEDLDLEELDPEVASLYLYRSKGSHANQLRMIKDEDNESGRGMSLPQSPVSMDQEQESHDVLVPKPQRVDTFGAGVMMSLCGGLKESEGEIPDEKFLMHLVTFDDFCQNPNILSNSNLVVKIENKYYNWQIAGPMVMSVLAFQRPLPELGIENLIKEHMPKKERKRGWMWWSRGPEEETATSKKDLEPKEELLVSSASSPGSSVPTSPQHNKELLKRHHLSDEDSDSSGSHGQMSENLFKKTTRLTSEQLAKLNLVEGPNEITFAVTTQYQGTAKCRAFIYLWKWNDQIIVSDVDGTITRSDVLGQLLPFVGKDWSQAGIANLYSMAANNGYRFLYLSARAIGQSRITRDYLRSVRQQDVCLPDGPLLLSPSSLISAFHKEVILRNPEEFKIACLRDVAALFPKAKNPFYAGFGNKVNDVWSYRAVGIPISRIFTVNSKGELRHELNQTFQSSYSRLGDVVDHFFPPLHVRHQSGDKIQPGFHAPDEYSTFTYWREPILDVTDEIEQFKGETQEKS